MNEKRQILNGGVFCDAHRKPLSLLMPSELSSVLQPSDLPVAPTRAAPAEIPIGRIKHGTPHFWATARAMFFGGFSTFAMLYGLQPLMPMFSDEFALSPAAASGVVSAATGALALML